MASVLILLKGGTGPPRAGVKNDDGRKELEKKREAERARRMETLVSTLYATFKWHIAFLDVHAPEQAAYPDI